MVFGLLQAKAYDFSAVSPSGHTLYYNIVNGHAEVVRPGYLSSYTTDLSGNLIIPDSVLYNNITYSVTILADLGDLGTFQGCSNLTSVSIPNTIMVIESNTFRDCYALSSISIPSSVTSLGYHSFWNCMGLMSVYFSSSTPPSIHSTAFVNTPSNKVFFVPCEYLLNYTNTWGISYNIQCYNTLVFNLTINTNDSIWGTGSYVEFSDSIVEITANANYGYHFDHWSTGSTANPDTVTLNSDTTITAFFAPNQYSLYVSSSDSSLCSVGGSGLYEYLDTISISATTIAHHHFVCWNDGNTMNPRDVIITNDTSFMALSAIDTHSVSLQVDSIIHGICNGNGNYAYGTAATAVAIPYSGYQFSHWSNGSTYNPYTFAVVDDIRLTANFRTAVEPYQDTFVLHDTLLVHDTAWLTAYIHDTAFVNHYIHDTLYLTQWMYEYIHDTLIQTVTQYVHDTTFINNYIHDTTYLDRYIYEYLHDTIMQYINHYIHDTTYINNYIHDTAYINNYIHDTAFIYQYIHDTIVNYVNHYIHDTTFVNNYIYDTIYIYRYIYDTIYIHDTIYLGEEGIADIALLNAKIYQRNGLIVVEGAEGNPVYLYDVVGRLLATKRETAQEVLLDVPASGVYLVKIGDAPARRIVVKR